MQEVVLVRKEEALPFYCDADISLVITVIFINRLYMTLTFLYDYCPGKEKKEITTISMNNFPPRIFYLFSPEFFYWKLIRNK